MSLCRHRQPEQWAKHPRLYAEVGRRILERGEPLLAYDLFQEGLAACPKDTVLLRLLALSLARSGAPGRASEILTGLYQRGHRDEETLGILARTHKDSAAMSASPRERDEQRRLAYNFYLRSYRGQKGYYAGVNAAAMALLLGRREAACRLAREVRDICLPRSRRPRGADAEAYWIAATLGESSLILGDLSQAEFWYSRAARLSDGRNADISSTRRQARLILKSMGRDMAALDACLKLPSVVAFSGHRVDSPKRAQPRFPASAESAVRLELARRLEKLNAGFGFASAACGSDILFLEEMLKRGGEIQIILPCAPSEFRVDSVDVAGLPGWGARFERLLRRAGRVHVVNDHGKVPGNLGYEYANLLIDGLARLRAASLDTELIPLAVWDGKAEEGAGGTGSLVRHWRNQGLATEIISLPRRYSARSAQRRKVKALRPEIQSIKAILFADVVGYSRLGEEQIPAFLRRFMAVPGRLLRNWSHPPEAKATWGDALYFIFADVENAGRFALELSERIMRVHWAKFGLPKNLSFRISLHAGPVYRVIDPVTGRPIFTGTHVTHGARIEPIAPPGHAYASQAFAAISASRGVKSFTCEYVGEVPLAKGFGTWPLYHLRQKE